MIFTTVPELSSRCVWRCFEQRTCCTLLQRSHMLAAALTLRGYAQIQIHFIDYNKDKKSDLPFLNPDSLWVLSIPCIPAPTSSVSIRMGSVLGSVLNQIEAPSIHQPDLWWAPNLSLQPHYTWYWPENDKHEKKREESRTRKTPWNNFNSHCFEVIIEASFSLLPCSHPQLLTTPVMEVIWTKRPVSTKAKSLREPGKGWKRWKLLWFDVKSSRKHQQTHHVSIAKSC